MENLARDRARLLALLKRESFERRKVTLSSGKESDFYIDCKRTALTAEGHYLLGRLLFAEIHRVSPEVAAVGGLTLRADPLTSAVSLTSYLEGHQLQAFIVREEPKGHGTGQWIEGLTQIRPGAAVAILEDVVTTGASTLRAIERAQSEGLVVAHVFAIVDRQEGGREAVLAKGHGLTPLFSRPDFMG